jgi:hypothetical protein
MVNKTSLCWGSVLARDVWYMISTGLTVLAVVIAIMFVLSIL